MAKPDMICRHSRGKRITGGYHPLCKGEASTGTAVGIGIDRARAEYGIEWRRQFADACREWLVSSGKFFPGFRLLVGASALECNSCLVHFEFCFRNSDRPLQQY